MPTERIGRVTVFGIGEAGSLFATGLAAAGVSVRAYDPAGVDTPPGVERAGNPRAAVDGTEVVLALTAGHDAPAALNQALDEIPKSALYADLSTAAPTVKRALAERARAAGLAFADVALMSTVPGKGLQTPALASGPGAARYVAQFGMFGVPVTAIGDEAGTASARKLLRSIVMKGLSALVVEALRGAEKLDCSEWLWQNLNDEIAAAGPDFIARLLAGTRRHGVRRIHEMEASGDMLAQLGLEPLMARATTASLRACLRAGMPAMPGAALGQAATRETGMEVS